MQKVYSIELPEDNNFRRNVLKQVKRLKSPSSRGRTLVFLEDLTLNGSQDLNTQQLYEIYGEGFVKCALKNLQNVGIIVRIKVSKSTSTYSLQGVDDILTFSPVIVTESKGDPEIDKYRENINNLQ